MAMTPRAAHHMDQLTAAEANRDAGAMRRALANVEKSLGKDARREAEKVFCKPKSK
jgi:hypothetical protein